MTCPVCPCPTCVDSRRQNYPGYPALPGGTFGMWQCQSCRGWYTYGTSHACGGGWGSGWGGGDKSPPTVMPL